MEKKKNKEELIDMPCFQETQISKSINKMIKIINMNKQITFSNEEYTGYSNEEIKQLNKEIRDHLIIIEELREKIKNIRSNCNHVYLFVCSGPYEDYYTCKICGNEIEK